MSKQLPPQPSLEQLKKQAKDLRKAHQSADPEAAKRIQEHLPRLSGASEEEILGGEFSLQEAQHVIAGEYGFKNWNWLQAVVEVDFDLLAKLTDREIQTLRREVDQKDLVVSLKAASEEVKEKVVRNISERVWTFITEEMEFLGPMPLDEVEEVQRRVLHQTAALAVAGQIDWPNGEGPEAGKAAKPPVFQFDPGLTSLLGKSLEQLAPDEIVEMWEGLAEQARREGILSLEPAGQQIADPLVREALQLAVDGTEPDLIRDVLETRSQRAMLPQQETRGAMVIEALVAIMAGDNPRIVHHKLGALYQSEPSETGDSLRKVAVEELTARLRETPFARMEFGQIDALFIDMSSLTRREGIAALVPLIEAADDPLLRQGLEMIRDVLRQDPEMIRDEATVGQVIEALEAQRDEGLRQAEARHRMVIAGIEAIQQGKRPAEIAEIVRQAGP